MNETVPSVEPALPEPDSTLPTMSGWLHRYERVVGSDTLRALEAIARRLQGHRIVMVNTTKTGGGVAEILHRLVCLLQIVFDKAAIDVGFRHLRIALHGACVIILRAVEQARLLVNMPGEQREIGLFGKQILVG